MLSTKNDGADGQEINRVVLPGSGISLWSWRVVTAAVVMQNSKGLLNYIISGICAKLSLKDYHSSNIYWYLVGISKFF